MSLTQWQNNGWLRPHKTDKEEIASKLYFCANEAALAFELLENKKFKSILGNIIYLGLEETFKKELNK